MSFDQFDVYIDFKIGWKREKEKGRKTWKNVL